MVVVTAMSGIFGVVVGTSTSAGGLFEFVTGGDDERVADVVVAGVQCRFSTLPFSTMQTTAGVHVQASKFFVMLHVLPLAANWFAKKLYKYCFIVKNAKPS